MRKALTFYEVTRSTGITWMAIRGDEPLRIMQRAGHTSFDTTLGYIREAENLRTGFGSVFPPLPVDLRGTRVVSVSVSAFGVTLSTPQPKTRGTGWAQQDLNL